MRSFFQFVRDKFEDMGRRLRESMAAKVLLGLLLVAFISTMFPEAATHDYEYDVGNVWIEEDLIADRAFPIYRDAEIIEQEYEQARKSTPRSLIESTHCLRPVSTAQKLF